MTRSRFVALPPVHVAPSRLAWRISRAIVAREQGWSLDHLSVSRRWRFQVGRSRWIAQAYVSFFRSALVHNLRSRLGTCHACNAGKMLAWKLSDESSPPRLLTEMDRVAQAFDTNDSHRSPPSRSRELGKRLAVIAEVVLAHGTWSLETPGVELRRDEAVFGSISPMPSSDRGRPELYSQLMFVPDGRASGAVTAPVARAESHGYVDRAGKAHPPPVLGKLQPLSLRAALTEARFIETEVSDERHTSRA